MCPVRMCLGGLFSLAKMEARSAPSCRSVEDEESEIPNILTPTGPLALVSESRSPGDADVECWIPHGYQNTAQRPAARAGTEGQPDPAIAPPAAQAGTAHRLPSVASLHAAQALMCPPYSPYYWFGQPQLPFPSGIPALPNVQVGYPPARGGQNANAPPPAQGGHSGNFIPPAQGGQPHTLVPPAQGGEITNFPPAQGGQSVNIGVPPAQGGEGGNALAPHTHPECGEHHVVTERTEPDAHADIVAEPRAKRANTGNFDPAERVADTQMKYLARAPPEVTDYLERHFRRLLPDEERKQMHLDHPRPDCDAMQVPRVDEAMDRWLGPRLPKQTDKQWRDIQIQLLSCTGPLTNMWTDMVADAKQQAERENTSQQEELEALAIPAPAVMEMIQRTLVLIGSIHANINQRRRVSILEAIDKDFGSYATAEANTSQGKLLFGQDFTEALQEKVKANSSLQKTVGMLQQARRQTVSQPTKDDRSMRTLGSSRPRQRTRVMPFQRGAWRNRSDQANHSNSNRHRSFNPRKFQQGRGGSHTAAHRATGPSSGSHRSE